MTIIIKKQKIFWKNSTTWGIAVVLGLCWWATVVMSIDFYQTMAHSNGNAWTTASTPTLLIMWTVMMAAMMLPSFIPTITLLLQLQQKHPASYSRSPIQAFIGGYLFVWIGFSAAAVGLQQIASQSDLLNAEWLLSNPHWRGGLLLVAGIYQLTPLKAICLEKCRHPAIFLMLNWRNNSVKACKVGSHHGLYCMGCCGFLMLLLFVGGLMHLGYIITLTLCVLIEKTIPYKPLLLTKSIGVLLIVAAMVQLLL